MRRRFAPHQLRHADALEIAREGIPLIVIRRQLGNRNFGITSVLGSAPASGICSQRRRLSCGAPVDDLPVGPVIVGALSAFAEGELGAADTLVV